MLGTELVGSLVIPAFLPVDTIGGFGRSPYNGISRITSQLNLTQTFVMALIGKAGISGPKT